MKKRYHFIPALVLCMSLLLIFSISVCASENYELTDNGVEINFKNEVINLIRAGTYDKGKLFTLSSSFASKNPSAQLLTYADDVNDYIDSAFLSNKSFYVKSPSSESQKIIQYFYGLDVTSDILEECNDHFDYVPLGFDYPYNAIRFLDASFFPWSFRSGAISEFYYNSAYKTIYINKQGQDLYIIYDESFFIFYEPVPKGVYNKIEKIRYNCYQLSDGTSSYFLEHIIHDSEPEPGPEPDPGPEPGPDTPAMPDGDIYEYMRAYLAFSVFILSAIAENPVMSFILACPLIGICIYVFAQIKRAISDNS